MKYILHCSLIRQSNVESPHLHHGFVCKRSSKTLTSKEQSRKACSKALAGSKGIVSLDLWMLKSSATTQTQNGFQIGKGSLQILTWSTDAVGRGSVEDFTTC